MEQAKLTQETSLIKKAVYDILNTLGASDLTLKIVAEIGTRPDQHVRHDLEDCLENERKAKLDRTLQQLKDENTLIEAGESIGKGEFYSANGDTNKPLEPFDTLQREKEKTRIKAHIEKMEKDDPLPYSRGRVVDSPANVLVDFGPPPVGPMQGGCA